MSTDTEYECDCGTCAGMCQRFPCRPKPAEVREMPTEVRARLSLQHDGEGLHGIPHLQPAVPGHEGGYAHNFDIFFGIGRPGRCTFLTDDNRCELHGKCKPWEGRVTKCGVSNSSEVLDELDKAWSTDEGREVLEEWREEFLQ